METWKTNAVKVVQFHTDAFGDNPHIPYQAPASCGQVHSCQRMQMVISKLS